MVERDKQASHTEKEMFSTRFHFTLQDSLNVEENFSRNKLSDTSCMCLKLGSMTTLAGSEKGIIILVETNQDLPPFHEKWIPKLCQQTLKIE